MHFEKIFKQLTEIFEKSRGKKTKAPTNLQPAKNSENLFDGFLFCLKPTVIHQKINTTEKSIESKETKKQKKDKSEAFKVVVFSCKLFKAKTGS